MAENTEETLIEGEGGEDEGGANGNEGTEGEKNGAGGGKETDEDLQKQIDEETDPAKIKELNKKLFARAKTAEGFKLVDGKWVKPAATTKPKPAPQNQNKTGDNSTDPVQQARLVKALNEFSDDEVELAQTIAKGKGIDLLQALKEPAVQTVKAARLEAEKKEKSKLGAARGSSQGDDDGEPVVKPGMSEAEHKAAWKKALGKK